MNNAFINNYKNMLYSSKLKHREVCILMYLIDNVNDDLTYIVSIRSIAENLKLSVSTIKRGLSTLKQDGFLKIENRFLEELNGAQGENLYTLIVPNKVSIL